MTQLQDITRWVLNRREENEDFDEWYSTHADLIDASIRLVVTHANGPMIINDSMVASCSFNTPNDLPAIAFEFRLDADRRILEWQVFDLKNGIVSTVEFQGRQVHGLLIDDDVEMLLGSGDLTDYRPGRYHCTTGPHNNLNGCDRFFLWGAKIDPEEYWSIVKTPESIEHYYLIHLMTNC